VLARVLLRLGPAAGAAARGYGQVLFCESVAGGVMLAAAAAVVAPRAAAASVFGCLVSTLAAVGLGLPALQWRAGFYGYAGALLGFFWSALVAPTPLALLVLAAAAALAAPLTRLAHLVLVPREIPALALPALALAWLAWPFLEPATGTAGPTAAIQLVGGGLVVLALVTYSALLAQAALLGGVVGLVTSLLLAGRPDAAVMANAVPTAMALAAALIPWTPGSVALGAGAAGLAGALAWAAPGAAALPPLVAPFNAVTLGALLAWRGLASSGRAGALAGPVRLARAGRPEEVRDAWRARRRLADLVARAGRICVFTGAGVSTAAGLPDVRGSAGLWARTRRITVEEFARSEEARAAYWRHEEDFFRLVRQARPAAVHAALAVLWSRQRLTAVVTQNVDGLHQAAGLPGPAVIELHGSVRTAACLDCGLAMPREALSPSVVAGPGRLYCPACQGLLKGGGTMFGEPVSPGRLDASLRALLAADLLLVLGTALAVSPASEILAWARDAGIPVAIVNATPTAHDGDAAVVVRDDVNDVLADLVAREQRRGPAARPRPIAAS
jgi:NAD-dependent deacetylase